MGLEVVRKGLVQVAFDGRARFLHSPVQEQPLQSSSKTPVKQGALSGRDVPDTQTGAEAEP